MARGGQSRSGHIEHHRTWTSEHIPLGDIYYSQDTIRDRFSGGGSIADLIAAFRCTDEPDQVLSHNRISVVPYPCGTSALYTLDNRRLFCLKFVYPPTQLIWVYRFDCVQDYDREWDSKFSTVTRGQSVAVKWVGYKSSLNCHSRHIPIPFKMACTSDFLDDVRKNHPFLTSIHLHPAEPDGWNKTALIEIRGRRCCDVDMAGAEIFSFLHSEPISEPMNSEKRAEPLSVRHVANNPTKNRKCAVTKGEANGPASRHACIALLRQKGFALRDCNAEWQRDPELVKIATRNNRMALKFALCCAVMCCAVLCCAVLCCAVLCYVVLCCVVL